MLAVQVVLTMSFLALIYAFALYMQGQKKLAYEIKTGIFSANAIYFILVLILGVM